MQPVILLRFALNIEVMLHKVVLYNVDTFKECLNQLISFNRKI